MSESLRSRTAKGIIWSSIERFSVQFVQLIISVLIARVLTPEDYGVVGMLAIFLAIAQTFVDSGFSNALIRKIDRTEIDNSTVFYFNIVVGIIFYIVLFFSAPAIAKFYNTPILIPITRVLSLGIFFNSLTIVQRAILTAKVDFKTQAKSSLISALISGGVGLYMAYSGYGVWALVIQSLISFLLNTSTLWLFTKWVPLLVFSWKSFKEMFGFGSKLLLSALLDTTYNNIYTIIIGKVFSSSDLGLYTRANSLAQFPSSNLTGIMQRVTYPLLCEYQDQDERLKQVYRKYLKLSAFIIFPLMIGLASVAYPFIITVLSGKWSGVVILLQIMCLGLMLYPIHAINLNLLQVKGRSDLFLRLEIIKKAIGVTILIITIPMGLVYMCIGQVISSIICLAVNTFYTGKLIDLGFFKQLKDLLPALAYSLSMGAVAFIISYNIENSMLSLIAGVLSGVIYFYAIAKLTNSPELKDLLSLIGK
ncbi:MAG: lipopolysaccharide biosynthesis protein [Bacteroidales bacterium]|nr:lipopolysaccharide biosynthesis protein [Bacteroidales bacterium]MBQ8644883.1 lipopolysaccharide biosynthesis protein [Bacteroidales bacterium]